jgi:hypothetical protein
MSIEVAGMLISMEIDKTNKKLESIDETLQALLEERRRTNDMLTVIADTMVSRAPQLRTE